MYWLQEHFFLSLFFLGLLALVVGSFLNVVIYRLPIMLQKEWTQQCHDYLKLAQTQASPNPLFNLCWPGSHCPQCQGYISPWYNIPLLSFIILKGRCQHCQAPIPLHYPLVELFTAVSSLLIVLLLGLNPQSLALVILCWCLIAASVIDIQHQILPDNITLTLLWVGLLLNTFSLFNSLHAAVIGAIVGYCSLWLINYVFRLIRGMDGIGNGDFKLFAMFGAWFGWQQLPLIILFAAAVGTLAGILLMIIKGYHKQSPIPFGPFIAMGGMIAAIWGQEISQWYLLSL